MHTATRRAVLLGGLAAPAILSRPARAQRARVLRFGSPQPVGSTYDVAMKRFAAEVGTLTNNHIRVDVFPSSQLGSIRDMLTAVQLGTLSMAAAVPAWFSGFVKPMDVFALPYLVASPERLRAALQGALGERMGGLADAANFRLLGSWLSGPRQFINNAHPILSPADCAGLKMRVIASPVYLRFMAALGANPVVLDAAEIYLAMQQHVVDGLEYAMVDARDAKLYEVSRFITLDGHVTDFFFIAMNKGVWQGLSADEQAAVTQAMKTSTDAQWDAQPKATEDAVAQLGKLVQVATLTAEQRAAFADKTRPIYADFQDSIGRDLIADATRQLGTA